MRLSGTRFRKRSQGNRTGGGGATRHGEHEEEHEGDRSTAIHAGNSPERETRLRRQGEGTHHFLSQSPRETPAGPPAPALRAAPPPHLRPPPHPATSLARTRPPALSPEHAAVGSGVPSLSLPMSPVPRCGLRADRTPVPTAGLVRARRTGARCWRPLPARVGLAYTPASCSCFTVSRAPPPPAGLPLAFPHPSV